MTLNAVTLKAATRRDQPGGAAILRLLGNHEQTNLGGDCSEWLNDKLQEVSPCAHQVHKQVDADKTQTQSYRNETKR